MTDSDEAPMLRVSARVLLVILCAVLSLTCYGLDETPTRGRDGKIVKTESCEPFKTGYTDYVAYQQKQYQEDAKSAKELGVAIPSFETIRSSMVSAKEYEHRLHDARFECVRMVYLSDGLRVIGYLFKPRRTLNRHLPAIIYNRGGHADLDEVGTITLLQIHPFLEAGFVVLAPQYRGSDGGEGQDEFGGADVHDVLNIVSLARSLSYVDVNNLFMYGVSRGGMETYLALKNRAPINAAAVMGASADEVAANQRRPLTDVYKKLVPGFNEDPQSKFRERSAIYWTEQLNRPILMLHGGADWRVSPSESLKLASHLQELKKVYQIFVYADDDHDLSIHREQRDRHIIQWFDRYKKLK